MSGFIDWVANWPEWVGVPIGLAISLGVFFYLKKKWNL